MTHRLPGDIRIAMSVPRLRVQIASDCVPLGRARARELARELNAYADFMDAIGSKADADDPWRDGEGYPESNPPGGWVSALERTRMALRRPFVWGVLYGRESRIPVRCVHDAQGQLDDHPYHVDYLERCTFPLAIALWSLEWDCKPQPAPWPASRPSCIVAVRRLIDGQPTGQRSDFQRVSGSGSEGTTS